MVALFVLASRAEGQSVLISEFMAANDSVIQDKSGNFTDWVELFNYGEEPQDLSELYLTDDPDNLTRLSLPEHQLKPGEYYVVWLAQIEGGFQLNVTGDYLALVSADGKQVLHDFGKEYPKQERDISYGLPSDWRPGDLVSGESEFLLTPTPGKPNSRKLEGIVKDVILSQKRGFYQKPFKLKMATKTEGADIRYTLDGSPPGPENGEVYNGPIEVSQTSVIRAAAFKEGYHTPEVKTRTYIFASDVARQSPDGLPPEGWPYLWGENQVDYGMDPDVIDDPLFAGKFDEALTSIPSISLVLRNGDLLNEKTGIYSNAMQDGREWERPCSVEFIHPEKPSKDLQIDAGLRIRGGFSRMGLNPKHAFRLFFRDMYGPSKLQAHMFPDKEADAFDNLDLRTFQNYSWSYQRDPRATFLRDQFNRDLQLAMGQPAARGEYYHLFINGQYWGIFNTCERPKASFGAAYFGGEKEDYDAVKKGNVPGTRLNVMATDGNLDAWRQLWEQAKAGLESNEAYFKLLGCNPDGTPNPEYPVLLDPENLIDYMLIIFYGGNLDAPVTVFGRNQASNNWHSLRNRKLEARQGFQFFVWDAEHTFLDVEEDRTGPYPAGQDYAHSNPQYIYQQCLDNAEFRQLVADRIHAAFFNGGVLSASAVKKRFMERASQIEKAVICESARWGDVIDSFPGHKRPGEVTPDRIFTQLDWKNEIQRISSEYIPRRSGIVLNQLYSQGLWPDVPAPKPNTQSGKVKKGFKLSFGLPDKALDANGKIFYSVDGSDPRSLGGGVSSEATSYSQPVKIKESSVVMARSLVNGEWSPLTRISLKVK